jgi:hypothetical protein
MKSRPASRRGALVSPRYLEIAPDGTVFVCDEGADAVIRIDAISGAQTPLTSGGLISSCEGLALRSNGQLLATDRTNDWLLKHDPVAGVLPPPLTPGGAFGELHNALPMARITSWS